MSSIDIRKIGRLKRKRRIRKKIYGTADRPRLCVFRSAKHIYAQIINDVNSTTLVCGSSLDKEFLQHSDIEDKSENKNSKIVKASLVGKIIGSRAIEKGIKEIVFDRNGFLYHGRVKAVAEGARGAGLQF
jgi:large subunit ribosomal protein L18